MEVSKQVTLKLFFNLSNRSFYVQINDMLFIVRDTVVSAIQDREGVEIRHVADIKEMQLIDK
jgi:hypothetical protein